MLGGIIGNDNKSDKPSDAPSTRSQSAAPPSTVAPPPGSVPPEGVNFSTTTGADGEIVTAQFQIADALLMTFTKTLARSMTTNILRYADNKWPDAGAVIVQGSFQTVDPYGNSENSVVLNVTYLRDVLDKLNYDGYIEDIWAVRSSGFIHPDLQ